MKRFTFSSKDQKITDRPPQIPSSILPQNYQKCGIKNQAIFLEFLAVFTGADLRQKKVVVFWTIGLWEIVFGKVKKHRFSWVQILNSEHM